MSSEPTLPTSRRPAAPGEYSCTRKGCPRAGSLVAPPRCPDCGDRVHLLPLQAPGASNQPQWAPNRSPQAPRSPVGAGDLLSRVIFGGFWAVVTVGLVLGGLAGATAGHPQALVALLPALLTGIYARYIFRGGRFRILFW